jgi:hypothetical protein
MPAATEVIMNLSEDALARQVNAQPWEPLPGMLKLRCSRCSYWFAAWSADTERCPDCAKKKRVCVAINNEEE